MHFLCLFYLIRKLSHAGYIRTRVKGRSVWVGYWTSWESTYCPIAIAEQIWAKPDGALRTDGEGGQMHVPPGPACPLGVGRGGAKCVDAR